MSLEQEAVLRTFLSAYPSSPHTVAGSLPLTLSLTRMPSLCLFSLLLLQPIRWEPQLRCGQDGSIQDFKWMPRTGYR